MSNPGEASGRESPDSHPFRMTQQERDSLDPNYKKPKKKARWNLILFLQFFLTKEIFTPNVM
jgi:hypothetical protein